MTYRKSYKDGLTGFFLGIDRARVLLLRPVFDLSSVEYRTIVQANQDIRKPHYTYHLVDART